MKTFAALIKREVLDGKNGYILVPLILTGITLALVVLSSLGVGNILHFDGMAENGITNLADALNQTVQQEPGEMAAGVTLLYWTTGLSWIALPFVIFFSLLGTLYEERRDRSILFWKAMPVADWQEVLAKLFTPLVLAPLMFLAVAIAAQLFTALFLSLIMIFQGGPVLELWPLGLMISSWFAFMAHYLLWALWALPVLAWLLFVSSFAGRMPFLWAILTPVVLVVVEGMFLKSSIVGNWLGTHLGGWQDHATTRLDHDIDGPRDILNIVIGDIQWDSLTYSIASAQFWLGIIIAAGFIFGAIEMRKRAI